MVTYDLAVVGAGYWGAAIAYEAKKLGWKVIVLDDGDSKSGSRNASGICDPRAYTSSIFSKYWPSEWSKTDLDESLQWLLAHKGYKVQEWFWNLFAGTQPRQGTECIYISSVEVITQLAYPRTKQSLEKLKYKRLVVAAGYRTDEVLQSLELPLLGVKRLAGRGILARGNAPSCPTPVSVMIRPYVKHTVRSWAGGLWKVGDTAEETLKEKPLEALRSVGRAVLENYEEVQVNEGYRPMLDRFTVEKLSKNIIVATGGGRLGLGLCGLVAKKSLEMFQ